MLTKLDTRLTDLEDTRLHGYSSNEDTPPSSPAPTKKPAKSDVPHKTPAKPKQKQKIDNASDDLAAAAASAKARLEQLGLAQNASDNSDDSDDEQQEKKTRGKHSGRVRTANHKSNIDIDWPHFYVYRDAKPTTYEQLTLSEFVYGCLSIIDNAPNSHGRWLQAHLRDLMEDATLYKWQAVRDCHAIILQMMETGRISPTPSQQDCAQIMELRRLHIWNRPHMARQQFEHKPPTQQPHGRPQPLPAITAPSM